MRCLATASALVLALASPAAAQCPGGSVFSLSSDGWTWDFDAGGAVVDGNGAYDGLYRLYVDGAEFNGSAVGPTPEGAGRGVVFQQIMAGVGIRRHILVPAGESYARWIDEVTNTNITDARTFTIELRTNSGYDADQEVVSTADGDTTLEAADLWFVLDNALVDIPPDPPFLLEETPPPASCFVIAGADALAPTAISATGGACPTGFPITSTEGSTVRFSLTIPAAGTMYLMYFAALGTMRADAMATCAMIAPLPTSLYADVSAMDRERIQNWALERPLGAPCATDAQCITAHCEDGVCCMTACGGSTADCEACSSDAGSTAPDGTCGMVRSTGTCRPATGECDLPERCDGSSRTCPADAVRASGYLCRPDRGTCDLPDTCNGTSPTCPTDSVEPAGTVCDALGMLDCWSDGVCTGTSPACPAARMAVDRTPCDDGMTCTTSWCMSGACLAAGTACDDRDPCTTDTCNSGMTCDHVAMAGCDGGIPPLADAGPPEFKDVGASDPDGGGSGDEDGSITDMDGSTSVDAGARRDAPRRDGDPVTTEELTVGGGGCICRAGGRRDLPLGLGVLLLGLVLGRRARR